MTDFHDVVTHRSAWKKILEKVKTVTNDDEGSGYYSHEIEAFDRTFDLLEKFLAGFHYEIQGGQDRKYKFENGFFVNRISGEPIPHDEPTIILRGRDTHALSMLKDYQYMTHDEHHKQAVQDRIDEFESFAMNYPERMKEPGVTGHMQLNADVVDAAEADPT